jgi:LPXTG-motif cell wall-anchored protein
MFREKRYRGVIVIRRVVVAFLIATALAVSPVAADPAFSASCDLAGGGTDASPWLVEDDADFKKIGDGGCSLSGHYKQTDSFTLESADNDPPPTDSVATSFSGVYDGDFYTITLGGSGAGSWSNYAGNKGVFGDYLSGTVKKLYLTGVYQTSNIWGQPLVSFVNSGGFISQVHSSVNVTVTGVVDTIRLSGLVRMLRRGAVIEYSSAIGNLTWNPGTVPDRPHIYGGLVAEAGADGDSLGATGSRSTEIRDSYSRVTVTWPSDALCKAQYGGILGNANQVGGDVYLVRTYSASSIATDSLSPTCATSQIGGLVGRSDGALRYLANIVNPPTTYTYLVSSFWATDLIGGVTRAVGTQSSTSSNQYVGGVPTGVGLLSGDLKKIGTFQSGEGGTPGTPSDNSDLPIQSSTGFKPTDGNLQTNSGTYRWGIEPGNQRVFVPVTYTDPTNFLTRTLLTDITVPQTMAGRGSTIDGAAVTNYPHLGRIWEICSDINNGYPVLVWEEETCASEGAAYSGVPTSDDPPEESGDGESRVSGVSDAKATADSGPQLAATGVSRAQSLMTVMGSALLMLVGFLMVRQRRQIQ